jgi:UDP-N-acetyl-D-glucosamine dehydrogenase
MTHLHRRGARLTFNDPFVDGVPLNGIALRGTPLSNHAITEADCVALLTPHSTYDLHWLADHASFVFDARNAYGSDRRPNVVRL